MPALINRGNIWLAKKTPERAIDDYTAAIEAEPASILAHVNRGIAWQTKKDFERRWPTTTRRSAWAENGRGV